MTQSWVMYSTFRWWIKQIIGDRQILRWPTGQQKIYKSWCMQSYLQRLWLFDRNWGRTVKLASQRFEWPRPISGWMTLSASSALLSHSILYASQWKSHLSGVFVLYGSPVHLIWSYSHFLQLQVLAGWKLQEPLSSQLWMSRTWYFERTLTRCT